MMATKAAMWLTAGVVLLALSGCHDKKTVYVQQASPLMMAEPAPPQPIFVQQAPPPPVAEAIPPPPGPGYVWVAGYWGWNGHQYVWQPGYWAGRPSPTVIWIGPRYERYGSGYHYTPGRWDHDRGGDRGRSYGPPRRGDDRGPSRGDDDRRH